jgi:hypothetical protein
MHCNAKRYIPACCAVLLDKVDADASAAKQTEFRDRTAGLKLQIDCLDRSHENADVAVKALNLLKVYLRDEVRALGAMRRIHQIISLNFHLVDVTRVPEMRKPFACSGGRAFFRKNSGRLDLN